MSPGVEIAPPSMMFAHTSQGDYDQLWRLDIWGLADCPENDQNDVYREFKEQLQRSEDGWYEIGLPWRGNHPPLPTNYNNSLQRLEGL